MASESGHRSRKRLETTDSAAAGGDVAAGVCIPSAADQLAAIASGEAVKEENRYPDRSQPSGPALGATLQLRGE